ncbi:MAG: hypothetical protein ACKPHU_30495 [Planctomycetaceae bacterium]
MWRPAVKSGEGADVAATDGEQIGVDGGCIGQSDRITGTADGEAAVDSEEVLDRDVDGTRGFNEGAEVAVEGNGFCAGPCAECEWCAAVVCDGVVAGFSVDGDSEVAGGHRDTGNSSESDGTSSGLECGPAAVWISFVTGEREGKVEV